MSDAAMSEECARRLLVRSREARWRFPSSFGRPVGCGDETAAWAERAATERGAFADAARHFTATGCHHEATEVAANVWRLWLLAGDVAGGRQFLGDVLGAGDAAPSRERALALYGDGLLAAWSGAHEDARARNELALEAARAVDDAEALALAHLGLSRVAFDDGDYALARDLAVEARRHAREVDPSMEQAPLHQHAQAARLLGDYDAAAALFTESLDLNRRIGDEGMVTVELHNLGHVQMHCGNIHAAVRCFDQLAGRGSADDPYSVALAALNAAVVAFAQSDLETARTRLAEAEAGLNASGTVLSTDDQFELDWLREQLLTARVSAPQGGHVKGPDLRREPPREETPDG